VIYLDFETYSEAGFVAKEGGGWERLKGAQKYGISAVGAAVYAQHPSTEILSCAYAFDIDEPKIWIPGMPMPHDLFDAMAWEDEEIEAHNSAFEVWIWRYVAVPKLRWPSMRLSRVRCSMARARAYSLPGALGNVTEVLQLPIKKDKDGERLLKLFSIPRQPTKSNSSRRTYPSQLPSEAANLYRYNATDIASERGLSGRIPNLSSSELNWWQVEQACNRRGVHVDMNLVRGAMRIHESLQSAASQELHDLTAGQVSSATEVARITAWLRDRGVHTDSLDEDAVGVLLGSERLDHTARRVLEIRADVASASVRKYATIQRQVAMGDRLHDLFNYHGAHTGRETAADVQPQNLPNSGPDVAACPSCRHHYGVSKHVCPWCASTLAPKIVEWNAAAANDAILVVTEGQEAVVRRYFDAVTPILSACLRGVFKATDGHVMVGADFSAIEGVGAAMLTNEAWRIEVFRTHGKIYEMAGAKMLGVPLEDILAYKEANGTHHPIRKRAKVGELAGGFGGGVGAWKNFGAEAYYENEDAIKEAVYAWRNDSPQFPLTWYAMHEAFAWCLNNPEQPITPCKLDRYGAFQGYVENVAMTYHTSQDVLRMKLPSGRYMTYHRPRLEGIEYGRPGLSYEGWNTNPANGPIGWIRKRTFGGRLFENLVQAACRDLLTHAAVNAYHAGYEIVLHVHDELCCEVPEAQYGVLNEHTLKAIMMDTPDWAKHWPVRAAGEWHGTRYQK
jgi:DNA polymerase bacteriophage-type